MLLRSLFLQQFRNYKEAFFEFSSGLNLFCGANAQGKTTLLEAIHYLMLGRSFRPGLQRDLIQIGTQSFYLEAIFAKHNVDQKLRIQAENKDRKMMHNSTPLPNATHLLGLIQGVVMTPDDVNLIKGAPPLRRQFLDIQLAQVDPLYVHYLTRYTKAMKHRNQLLREKKPASIESWEHEMAQAAGYIIMRRRKTIDILQKHCQAFYSFITNENEHLTLEYCCRAADCQSEKEIRDLHVMQYQKNRSKEMTFGSTFFGPHKDDIKIKIGERDARFFASEGQQRSCVVALHMGEWQCLKDISHDIPLFMIDDVGLSLDNQRRDKLIEQLASLGQIFLTTTDPHLIDSFSGEKQIFSIGEKRADPSDLLLFT